MGAPLRRSNGPKPPSNIAVLRCWPEPCESTGHFTRYTLRYWRLLHCRVKELTVTRESEYHGRDCGSLLQAIASLVGPKRPLVLCGCDVRVDLQLGGVLQAIDNGHIGVNWLLLAPRLLGTLTLTTGSIHLVDMASWTGCALTACSDWLGNKVAAAERSMAALEDEWRTLTSLVYSWLSWGASIGLGVLTPTLGRTAWQIWRKFFAPVDRETTPRTGSAPFLLPALGQDSGREAIPDAALIQPNVDCNLKGTIDGPIYELDVKSFYPCLYLGKRQPSKLVQAYHNLGHFEVEHLLRHYWCCAKIDLGPTRWPVPVAFGNTVRWLPTPQSTVSSGVELEWYHRAGAIRKVRWLAAYDTADYLSDFGAAFIERRLQCERDGNLAHSAFTKRVANALWGKFAPRRERWQRVSDTPPMQYWGEWFQSNRSGEPATRHRSLGLTVQRQVETEWSRNAWPAAAAFVCAEARHHINHLCDSASQSNVLYRLCDGLHVTKPGFDALGNKPTWTNTEPGELRIAGIYSSVTYHSQYAWEHPNGWRIAGLPRNAVRVEPGKYRATVFTGPAESYALGDLSSVYAQDRLFRFGG